MIIYLSLLVCIIGLLMEVLATNGKIVSVGRDMFWCGLLTFLLQLRPEMVTAIKG